MLSVGTCFNFVTQAQFYEDLIFRITVLESCYFVFWDLPYERQRPEASELSTNYRRKPCIFYDLGYCPINGLLDLYYFN